MKIIDAHFHLFPSRPDTDADVRAVGHENSADHLLACHRELGVIHGVVMGNGSIGPEAHRYPPQFSYCVGLDSQFLRSHDIREALPQVEEHLGRSSCVGVKLYPGYNAVYVSDPMYAPVYALARKYRKPVAVHMGMTAMSGARLKYSHPLTLDEVAADWPDVQFVMCHFGNPFLADAAAVLEKNPNVAADLSGLLEGRVDLEALLEALGKENLSSVLLEGGAELAGAALAGGLVQHLQAYIAPKLFGGRQAPGPIGGPGVELPAQAPVLRDYSLTRYGQDILLEGELECSRES